MIVHLKENITKGEAANIAKATQSVMFKKDNFFILITPSSVKNFPEELSEKVKKFFSMESDMQLSSKEYLSETRKININNITIGGDSKNTLLITGPCSIESMEQISLSADLLKELNLTTLRAGCYKPRTSPYSFQGLGLKGLQMLSSIRKKYGFNIISEVRDASHVNEVIEYVDIIQIGAKAMYDHGILKACGKQHKPVLLKRGFGSNLKEFVQAAEFILSAGNENVMLCERGIRTFETKTRFTLDYANYGVGYDYMVGNRVMANFIFSDILGDYNFYISTETVLTLNASDYYFIFNNLKNKIDKTYYLYQYVREQYLYESGEIYRIRENGFLINFSYPFSKFIRL